MVSNEKDLKLKAGLTPEYARSSLVRDIDCKDSILDLIDNSIDSIRTSVLSDDGDVDDNGMVVDFSGYEINIGFDKKSFYIEDNGAGIDPIAMQERLLVIGEMSNKDYGIGRFGVGLKRALLKIGNKYRIETSWSGEIYLIEFTANELTDANKNIIAKYIKIDESPSYTQIRIFDMSEDAIREIFQTEEWRNYLSREIGIRYSIFIKKGLVIKYRNVPIEAYCPGLRQYKSITVQDATLEGVPHGIKVKICAGLHEKYIFEEEVSHNVANANKELTGEYGWYYVCNDRVIKIACIEEKYGWSKRWHPEYYGFVGWIYFSGNAKDLPWNTKKTDIDPSSEVFVSVKDDLKNYASTYRSQNRFIRKKSSAKITIEENNSDLNSNAKKGGFGDKNTTTIAESANEVTLNATTSNTEERWNPAVNSRPKTKTKIEPSVRITLMLEAINSEKLAQLYNSLCKISLIEHPVLVSVGSWAFFETLAKLSGAAENTSFESYFNSKISQWFNGGKKKAFRKIVRDISERGNLDKHERDYYTVDAKQLAVDFSVAEPLIIKILEEIAEKDNAQGATL